MTNVEHEKQTEDDNKIEEDTKYTQQTGLGNDVFTRKKRKFKFKESLRLTINSNQKLFVFPLGGMSCSTD